MRIPRKAKMKVAINTTALPDIIFMLLFFFMVTTVIQDASLNEMIMAEAYNTTAVTKGDEDVLEVFLKRIGDKDLIQINDEGEYDFEDHAMILKNRIEKMRGQGYFLDKANLYVDASLNMGSVNKVKSVLRDENILKLKYIHKLEGQ